jgi:hypothetical protein
MTKNQILWANIGGTQMSRHMPGQQFAERNHANAQKSSTASWSGGAAPAKTGKLFDCDTPRGSLDCALGDPDLNGRTLPAHQWHSLELGENIFSPPLERKALSCSEISLL